MPSERMRGTEKEAVPLLKDLFGPQLDRYQRSLSLTAERHSLLAENLANLNTPGYKRKDMSFELVLETKLKGPARIQELRRRVSGEFGPSSASSTGPDLEKEVMGLAETEMRYQALSDFASNYIAGLRTVIKEGR